MSCPSCESNNSGIVLTTNCDCNCDCAEPICATPQPCTEITDSKCIIYTDPAIICGLDTVVTTNSSVSTALNNITSYFCANGGGGGGTGPAGPIGPAGVQGIQGVVGPTGPQGIAGSASGAGTTGATGPQGVQGVPGPVGPAGLNWQGSWSTLGIYAPDDAVGFNGASWFCLNAVGPSASNPLIDPTNWALLASEGAVGPAGPTGASGVAGAAGATGPQGPIGSTGIQGIQGIPGPTGAQGVQGIPGTGGTTNIGKRIGGGVVIAEWDENGVHKGLIASLTNLSALVVQWTVLAQQNSLIGPTAQTQSDGLGNTNAIILQTGAPAVITNAAGLARLHNDGGYTDWYLPSKWELSMCYNAATIVNRVLGVNSFSNSGFYWSSTELNVNFAYNFSFDYGTASNTTKSLGGHVRAVRIHNI
jgi:hypothetical protein